MKVKVLSEIVFRVFEISGDRLQGEFENYECWALEVKHDLTYITSPTDTHPENQT